MAIHAALKYDSSGESPLNEVFTGPHNFPSGLVYQKGAAVIRMMEHFLSTPVFNKGITSYLRRNAFGSVKPDNLYQALQDALVSENKQHYLGNLTVSSIMKTWDSQAGYPIVDVERDYSMGTVSLKQKPYSRNGEMVDEALWYIPITIYKTYNSSTPTDIWLTTKTTNFDYPYSDPLIINNQQTGFYRVNYDKTNWGLITNYLNSENYRKVHVFSRTQLLDDCFNLYALTDSCDLPLSLSIYASQGEIELAPLNVLSTNLLVFRRFLTASPEFSQFQNYIRYLFTKAFDYLGITDVTRKQVKDIGPRKIVVDWLCKHGHKDCQLQALQLLKEWKINGTEINIDMLTETVCGAMQVGDWNDLEFVYQKYTEVTNKFEQSYLLKGMSCVSEMKSLLALFQRVTDARDTLLRYFFYYAAESSNTGFNAVYDFVDHNYNVVKNLLDVEELFYGISFVLSTNEHLKQLEEFQHKHIINLSRAIDITRQRLGRENKIRLIKKWLVENFNDNV